MLGGDRVLATPAADVSTTTLCASPTLNQTPDPCLTLSHTTGVSQHQPPSPCTLSVERHVPRALALAAQHQPFAFAHPTRARPAAAVGEATRQLPACLRLQEVGVCLDQVHAAGASARTRKALDASIARAQVAWHRVLLQSAVQGCSHCCCDRTTHNDVLQQQQREHICCGCTSALVCGLYCVAAF